MSLVVGVIVREEEDGVVGIGGSESFYGKSRGTSRRASTLTSGRGSG